MKILIIKPSAFGDVVQALPVAMSLRAHWPEAQIDWVVGDAYASLLEGHPAIDRLVIYPRKRWTGLRALPEMWRWREELRSRKYDIAIDLQGLLRSGLMTWASGARRKIGLASAREGAGVFYDERVTDTQVHAAERYLATLEYLSVPARPHDFGLRARAPMPAQIGSEPYVVFHPYTRWETKLWPWRYYAELAQLIPSQRVVIVGQGPWFPLSGENIIDLRGKTDLQTLITVLAGAQAVLSPDSGPAHLAGALGVPTLVLFGATDWRKTRPAGPRVTIATANLLCSPCLLRECPLPLPVECMSAQTPTQIAARLETVLAGA